MSTSTAVKNAIKQLKAIHRAKWGATLGKRKCMYSDAKDCLGIALEDQFVGHRCRACIRHMHRGLYTDRLEKAGKQRKASFYSSAKKKRKQ
jgi:hypothetical protein